MLSRIKSKVLDPSDKGGVSVSFRRRRLQQFLKLMDGVDGRPSVLDIGGTVAYWDSLLGDVSKLDFDLTILNLEGRGAGDNRCNFVAGDATQLPFEDRSFDIVHSNSVIEHLFSWENQVKMAAETIRVGKTYYLQTPNRYFPIEPHYVFPLFQFLPRKLKIEVAIRWPLARNNYKDRAKAQATVDEIRLLTKREMLSLFPDCNLIPERILGLSKSYTAIGGDSRE